MNADRFLLIVRTFILLGLLGFFVFSLGSTLMAERRHKELPNANNHAIGHDPGIRVLLTDRSTKKMYHRRLDILILQACLLYCPDDRTLQIALDPQETVTIKYHIDGLVIDCNKTEETWNVSQVDIIPGIRSHITTQDASGEAVHSAFEAKDQKAVFALNRTRYRGSLSIIKKAALKLYAVNWLPIESYLEGVVPSEMPAKYPEEALRAQAICSRSYAYANILDATRKGTISSFDVHDTVQDQEYLGTTKETPNTTFAVQRTAGLVLTYNDECFPSYFSASSGGLCTPVGMAFPKSTCCDGQTPLDGVMTGKVDPYCLEGVDALDQRNTYWKHEVFLSPKQVKDSIRHWLDERKDKRNIGFVQDITVSNPLPGRVKEINILTSEQGAEFVFSGHDFRNDIIGPKVLRSTYWEKDCPKWDEDRKSYRIISYGRGHGVGMSQVSAYAMSKLHNMSARQILGFFYEHAEISRRWKSAHD